MKQRVISFHYTLKNEKGEVLDSSAGQEPLSYMEGGQQIVPGLEKEVGQLKTGEKKNIKVAAGDGYGQRDERFVIVVEKSELPQGDVQIGQQYELKSDKGSQVVMVTKVTDTQVTLDGNHPLAGEDLFFDVEVTEIREATDEEAAHGHAHGAGGHHH
ncbi:MAG: peptidylprolyl isomerase [Deltaproteobacteria bacterium]|nr:peptidylprolyl isomerase [Deltaproteobacteria bacterium]MDZ4224670.1 peptidylprolyl isomerase [bacterium]